MEPASAAASTASKARGGSSPIDGRFASPNLCKPDRRVASVGGTREPLGSHGKGRRGDPLTLERTVKKRGYGHPSADAPRPGKSEPCKVLLVDDDEDDYLITRGMLAEPESASFEVEWCATYDDALAAIGEHRHDAYLIDYRLGEYTGLDLVREAFESRPHAPVIVLTGSGD